MTRPACLILALLLGGAQPAPAAAQAAELPLMCRRAFHGLNATALPGFSIQECGAKHQEEGHPDKVAISLWDTATQTYLAVAVRKAGTGPPQHELRARLVADRLLAGQQTVTAPQTTLGAPKPVSYPTGATVTPARITDAGNFWEIAFVDFRYGEYEASGFVSWRGGGRLPEGAVERLLSSLVIDGAVQPE